MIDEKLKLIQHDLVSLFHLGQLVKVTYVPSVITNLSRGMTVFVEKNPQRKGYRVFVSVKCTDGQSIVCNADYLELATAN